MVRKGFTLVELLIVIAIIAILSGVVVVAVNPAKMMAKARDSRRLQDLDTIKTALSLYAQTSGSYPICLNDAYNCSSWTSWWATSMTSQYLANPPKDPFNPSEDPITNEMNCTGNPTYKDEGIDTGYCFGYFYMSDASGTNYELNTFLEEEVERMDTDGGDQPSVDVPVHVYETGTNLTLINALAF